MEGIVGRGYSGSYSWKPGFQAMLRPAVRRLARWRITANMLSVAALLLSAVAGMGLVALGGEPTLFLALPGVLLARMALNAMDGMLAREHGQRSTLGFYLNELGDVLSDACLIAPFALSAGVSGWVVAVVAVLAAVSEMAGAMAPAAGGERRYEGPLGKSDRALLLGALALWIGIAGVLPLWLARSFPWVMAALLAMTISARVRGAVSAETGGHASL